MKRAALYLRVSTEEQKKHGLSIDAQEEALRRYAKENQMIISGVYKDEGVSGRKGYKKRPEMLRLLRDVESGNLDVILFIKLDRWFRSVKEYYVTQDILDAHHVDWIAITEDYNTTTSAGRLNLNLRLSIAQNEAEMTSDRIKFVFDAKKAKGEVCSGSVPLGMKIEDKHVVIDPETAPIVLDLFNKFVELRSRLGLCKYALDKYHRNFSTYGIKYVLTNKAYLEKGLIPADLFDTVQDLIVQRSRKDTKSGTRKNNVYIFSGLMHCSVCGSPMRSSYSGKDRTFWYQCTMHGRFHDAGCPHSKLLHEKKLESYLLDNIALEAEKSNERARLSAQSAGIKDPAPIRKKMDKLKDLYLNDLIDRETYAADYTDLKSQLEAIQNQKPPAEIDLSQFTGIREMYDQLDAVHRKAFWARLIKNINVNIDNDLEITFN